MLMQHKELSNTQARKLAQANAQESKMNDDNARTKEIIEALNAPAKEVFDTWRYWTWWRNNWAIVDLKDNTKRTMLEA